MPLVLIVRRVCITCVYNVQKEVCDKYPFESSLVIYIFFKLFIFIAKHLK